MRIESPKEKTDIRALGRRRVTAAAAALFISMKIRQTKREGDDDASSKCSIPFPFRGRDCREREGVLLSFFGKDWLDVKEEHMGKGRKRKRKWKKNTIIIKRFLG